MEKFTSLTANMVTIPTENIDTDQIIPARFLKVTDKNGLGDNLFYDWRYNADGSPKEEFILNTEQGHKAQVLVGGDNFGCGSSREHAPWAIMGYGFKAVVSTSFADIFYNNCFKNGLQPIVVSPDDLDKLMDDAKRGANATLTIDLEVQEIRGPDGGVISFEIDPFKKHCLLNGLDDIGLTLEKAPKIDTYEKALADTRPWA
ncbi:MAG: 3-isopropylmalate dehydratase small subunit [Chloroflexota bacterium]